MSLRQEIVERRVSPAALLGVENQRAAPGVARRVAGGEQALARRGPARRGAAAGPGCSGSRNGKRRHSWTRSMRSTKQASSSTGARRSKRVEERLVRRRPARPDPRPAARRSSASTTATGLGAEDERAGQQPQVRRARRWRRAPGRGAARRRCRGRRSRTRRTPAACAAGGAWPAAPPGPSQHDQPPSVPRRRHHRRSRRCARAVDEQAPAAVVRCQRARRPCLSERASPDRPAGRWPGGRCAPRHRAGRAR